MIHILGIRHHGVGSARNVVARLHQLQPDLIMVEGAPELTAVVNCVGDEALIPPVAILVYNTVDPAQAGFYPFAEYSPEWQAMKYARSHGIPIEMIDAPHLLLTKTEKNEVNRDSLSYLAEIEGFESSIDWWDYRFERQMSKSDPQQHFESVFLAMKNLREAGVPSHLEEENRYREAFMRTQIRNAIKQKDRNIVVVCGAWHAPALVLDDFSAINDDELLKSLPASTLKKGVTWIPWTNSRLSAESAYGAGITAPAWYECQWRHPVNTAEHWLIIVAGHFRKKYRDISTAHIIETHRLAYALCHLRGRTVPNLHDLNESVVSVMCGGDLQVFDLIKKDLMVGEKIGIVPEKLPKHPLQADFEWQTKTNRLSPNELEKHLELDLRNPLDLRRSVLLHRLNALKINWARQTVVRTKGTFKEGWSLKWKPAMVIQILEMGIWGNTVELAAMHYLQHLADESKDIAVIGKLVGMAIPADLLMMLPGLLDKMSDLAALSTDIIELMAAVPAIADVSRYGNVRKTDLKAMQQLTIGMTERICIGLPYATYGLDEETARKLFSLLRRVNDALRLLEDLTLTTEWNAALLRIVYRKGTTPLLAGCICRLLLESRTLPGNEAVRLLGLALSGGTPAAEAAAWMEGFLEGSSKILLFDDALWTLVYEWVLQLTDLSFTVALPVLRRTFSRFPPIERRKIGEKVREGTPSGKSRPTASVEFDSALALSGLPMALKIMGLSGKFEDPREALID